MPAITFNYTAVACPAIPPLPTAQDLANDAVAPTTAGAISDGMHALDMRPLFNANGKRIDNIGRYGGGGPAINEGMALSDSGIALTVRIAAGVLGLDAGVPFAQTDEACANNATTHLWGTSGGSITPQTSLAIPAGLVGYLGRVTLASSVFTEIDQSGVLFRRRSGQLWRRTADQGMPTDTPPATISFYTQTRGGLYLWDGSQYWRVWEPLAVQAETVASGDLVSLPSGYQALMFAKLTVRGNLQTRGHLKIIGW